MEIRDLKLDGNSIGGTLLELFGAELTGRGAVCASCGAHERVARLDVYHGAGIVGRCCHCQAVVIRIVEGRDRTWVDLSGIASLELG